MFPRKKKIIKKIITRPNVRVREKCSQWREGGVRRRQREKSTERKRWIKNEVMWVKIWQTFHSFFFFALTEETESA